MSHNLHDQFFFILCVKLLNGAALCLPEISRVPLCQSLPIHHHHKNSYSCFALCNNSKQMNIAIVQFYVLINIKGNKAVVVGKLN